MRPIYNVGITIASHQWTYWDDAFSKDGLNEIVKYCSKTPLMAGTTLGTSDLKKVEKVRKSGVNFHDRTPETAWIFDELNGVITKSNEQFYRFDLHGYSFFQYTTYEAKERQRYDWHMDYCMGIADATGLERKLSLTLQLNDDYEGGEFEINGGSEANPVKVETKIGRAILFPSFMIHRVKPVTKGVRKSLVVWCLGPKFK